MACLELHDDTEIDTDSDVDAEDNNNEAFSHIDWKALSHDQRKEKIALEQLAELEQLVDDVKDEFADSGDLAKGENESSWKLEGAPLDSDKLSGTEEVPNARWSKLLETWNKITPQNCVQNLAALGPQGKQSDYLVALAVSITRPPGLGMENAIIPQVRSLYAIKYINTTFVDTDDIRQLLQTSKYSHLFGLSTRYKYRFVYTGAYQVLRPAHFKDRLYMLAALMDAPRAAGVFQTMLGRAIATQCWDRVLVSRWVEAISNIIFVFALVLCGTAVRGGEQPTWLLIGILAVLGCRSLYRCLLEGFWYVRLYGRRRGTFNCAAVIHAIAKYLTGWTSGILLFEVFTATFVLRASWKTKPGQPCIDRTCYWYSHPVLIMMVMTFKSFLSALGLISIIGDAGIHVFPAFATLISKESIRFTVFVMMCVLACLSGYYMFPIDENTSRTQSGQKFIQFGDFIGANRTGWLEEHMQLQFYYPTLMMAMKVFRLAIMGDFDVYELEGVDSVLKTTADSASVYRQDFVHNGTILGEIDDGDPDPTFHFGIQVYFMSVAFVVNIMIFNVYVGLLGTVYENALSMRSQILHEYRSILAFKDLLWEHCPLADPVTALPTFIVHRLFRGSIRWQPGEEQQAFADDDYDTDDTDADDRINAFVLAHDGSAQEKATYRQHGTKNAELADMRVEAVRKKMWLRGRTIRISSG